MCSRQNSNKNSIFFDISNYIVSKLKVLVFEIYRLKKVVGFASE